MNLNRRTLITAAATVACATAQAQACTLTARLRPIAFSDTACRESLNQLVRLINDAPRLSDKALATRSETLSINFASDVTEPILDYPDRSPIDNAELLRAWTRSAGTSDRAPIKLAEVNLLKGKRGVALYQFTLSRDRFFPEVTEAQANEDSCGVAEPAHFSVTHASYLGEFTNNRLRAVSAFDTWLREA